MDQIPQVAGAILILVAFIGAQRGRLSPQAVSYLVLNLIGSVILTAVALAERDWGFFMLEAVWAAVSLWSLVTMRPRVG